MVIDLSVVVTLAFVVLVSYFPKLLSGMVVEALVVGIGVEVLSGMNANVSAGVMTASEFSMPIP